MLTFPQGTHFFFFSCSSLSSLCFMIGSRSASRRGTDRCLPFGFSCLLSAGGPVLSLFPRGPSFGFFFCRREIEKLPGLPFLLLTEGWSLFRVKGFLLVVCCLVCFLLSAFLVVWSLQIEVSPFSGGPLLSCHSRFYLFSSSFVC